MYPCKRLTYLLINVFLLLSHFADAQVADSIYKSNIKTVRLYNYGDQLSMPILNLNTNDQVELHFDDLQADVKYYYYTFQLCDRDWNPVILSQFDYLKGFTQMRITNYRFSSIAFSRYTHYQATIPDRSSYPIKSGNYLIKVFLDGDTSKVAFTKRLLVVDNKSTISARVTQPFSPQYFRTHQRLEFNVN
ncbi:MAG TPA: type IX secretion system plug protein domain-containing protein, partial [Chitinophagaceae bacterium]|nr:type IX secretion system plug protein domain-containing protein [Chitinophagaceae bacterium]